MILNYIKIAWKVLLRHPFYTFITLFGISLTLTVLMVLTSFLDHLFGSHYPENKRQRSLYVTRLIRQDTTSQGRNMGPMSFEFLKEIRQNPQNARAGRRNDAVWFCQYLRQRQAHQAEYQVHRRRFLAGH